ncbi:hypothetical protein CR513_46453, partial [Mucuna pruriens]
MTMHKTNATRGRDLPIQFFNEKYNGMLPYEDDSMLRTTFGTGRDAKMVLVKYMVINARTSYNIILGRLALNRLRVMVSTPNLCMKYPVEG